MKNFLLTFCFALSFTISGIAQITTTNASFPMVGDTWYTAMDSTPYIFILDPSPTAQTWDFTFLEPEDLLVRTIEAASSGSAGADFPDADIILPFYNGDGYAKIHNDSIEVIGYEGSPVPTVPSFMARTAINPTHTSYLAGQTYGSTYLDSVVFHIEDTGAGINPNELPVPITVDSVMVDYVSIREDTADAWGTMETPLGTFDVIRVKQVEYLDLQVQAKINFFGWVNLADYGIEGLGRDTMIQYLWLSATDMEPIARVEKRPNGSNFVCEWRIDQAFAMMVNNEEVGTNSPSIRAFPNPAVHEVNFELNNLPTGEYQVNIYNIIGRQVATERLEVFGNQTFYMDVKGLNKGVYLYSFVNDRGEVMATQQLVINRP